MRWNMLLIIFQARYILCRDGLDSQEEHRDLKFVAVDDNVNNRELKRQFNDHHFVQCEYEYDESMEGKWRACSSDMDRR